ncbi:MAG TPA: cell division protein FtsQ/DivIB [Motilibacterales bacterium]|nr:cell division protein FtsQ/DivIB [Motilibacterales bacterium]
MTENDTAELGSDTAVDPEPALTPAAPTSGRHPRRSRRIVLAGAAGLGLLWWVGWHSPMTLVEHVTVEAPRGISAESIRLASGISVADHVASVDPAAVRLGIMTAIPAVADVQLGRALPDTIELTVTARTPLAAVEAGKGFYVMDADGVIYDKVAKAKGLPVVKARTDASREVARGVLLAIPEDLRARVTRISAKSRDDVTLGLRGGATVRWGGVEDSDLKARVLAGLMAVRATSYDVSAPLLPTTSGSPTGSTDATG